MFCHVPCYLISTYCPFWSLFIWLATPPSFQSFLSGLKYHSHLLHSYGLLSFLLHHHSNTPQPLLCSPAEIDTGLNLEQPWESHHKIMMSMHGVKYFWSKWTPSLAKRHDAKYCEGKAFICKSLRVATTKVCTIATLYKTVPQRYTNRTFDKQQQTLMSTFFSRTVSLSIYTSQNILFIFAYENLFLHLFLWYLYSHHSALKFPNQYFCLNNIFIFYSWVATRIATVHNFISYQV